MVVKNAFTVDLEDWYQAVTSLNAYPEAWARYESRIHINTERLLTLLDEFKIKATFFVLGCVAEDYPELIRKINNAGHEIGIHGYRHRMIHRLTPKGFAAELDSALEAVLPLVSQEIIGHRAPYFSINARSLWALDVLREKGFRYDSSFFPTRNMLYGYPDAPRIPHKPGDDDLVEFPLSTVRWGGVTWPIAGGFYLRAFPYYIIQKGIQELNQKGLPAIMYVHPWELDVDHRYNQVTPREWIVQYIGRGKLENKLRRLMSEFKFTSLGDLLDIV